MRACGAGECVFRAVLAATLLLAVRPLSAQRVLPPTPPRVFLPAPGADSSWRTIDERRHRSPCASDPSCIVVPTCADRPRTEAKVMLSPQQSVELVRDSLALMRVFAVAQEHSEATTRVPLRIDRSVGDSVWLSPARVEAATDTGLTLRRRRFGALFVGVRAMGQYAFWEPVWPRFGHADTLVVTLRPRCGHS
jgi:hypothetical protein